MYEKINPYIRRVWYHTMSPGEVIRERVIFDYELIYIKDGHACITIEDTPYITEPGDIFVVRPKQRHSIVNFDDGPLVQPHIHFDLEYYPDAKEVPISYLPLEEISQRDMHFFRPDILDSLYSPFPSLIRARNPNVIELMLVDLISAVNSGDSPFSVLNQKSLFLRLFYQVLLELQFYTQPADTRRDILPNIIVYMESNLDRPITIDELVSTFHISKSYLMSVFREIHGTSPIQYHMNLRINKAKYLLRFSSLSITEIATIVGFENIHSFSRVFKRFEGIPPTDFRNNLMHQI